MESEKWSYNEWLKEVYSLTVNRRKRDLALQLGQSPTDTCAASFEPHQLVELKEVIENQNGSFRLYYEAVDHWVRTKAEPFQAMLTTWMSGAKAYVRDNVIPFNDAINWCQNAPDATDRKTLARELLALCRFLTQFSHATWEAIISILVDTFGFKSYLDYNEKKRGISIPGEAERAKDFLQRTREKYFHCISPLVADITGQSLEDSSRFDAIYILGLRYLDSLFPRGFDLSRVCEFFENTGIFIKNNHSLKIHEVTSGRQSYCVPVEIPGEVHVIAGELRGWLDLESLFHELGHALSFLYTNPELPVEDKDFFHSAALAESYAFLLQKTCMSEPFLENVIKLPPETARILSQVHHVKWLTLTRRYAAKLLIETRNFDNVDFMEAKEYYSEVMKRETGFSYEPDTYLFDLMPDFYSLDYFQGFAGAATMEQYLIDTHGNRWFMETGAWKTLKDWWFRGNSIDLSSFTESVLGKQFDIRSLVKQLDKVQLNQD